MHFFVFFETTTAFISYLYRKFLNLIKYEKNQAIPVSHDHLFYRVM